ncbi:hypothetical protein BH11CYA1_BH11CYA1_31550 [soil metagenome]
MNSVSNSPLKRLILPVSLCFSIALSTARTPLAAFAAPDAMTPANTSTSGPSSEALAKPDATSAGPSPTAAAANVPATTTANPTEASGAVPPTSAAAAGSADSLPTSTNASSAALPGNDLKAEINKLDELRIKAQSANAQIEQRLMPIADMQKQIVMLEGMVGRSNPNVVMLYHLLARRYQQQAYVTGKFADSEKLYRWLTDTVTPQQKGFDELLAGSAYLAMADGYRMTKRYDVALTTYQRAVPIFLRGKKAAQVIIADYKTFGESAYEKQVSSSSDSKVKNLVIANKSFIEAIDKAQGNERYVATPVPDAYFGMAVCYLNKNDLAKAKDYLAKAKANGLTVVDIAKLKAAAKKPGVKAPIKAGPRAGVKKGR